MGLKKFFTTISSTTRSTGASGTAAIAAAVVDSSPSDDPTPAPPPVAHAPSVPQPQRQPQNEVRGIKEFNQDYIVDDPALRIPIYDFDPDIRDEVRRAYVLKGPTQLIGHKYPTNGKDKRSFCEAWYNKYEWVQYSVEKDAAFCFYCFLFRHDPLDEKFRHDVFTKVGFKTWKNAYKLLPGHVGGPTSVHNQARTSYVDFKN